MIKLALQCLMGALFLGACITSIVLTAWVLMPEEAQQYHIERLR